MAFARSRDVILEDLWKRLVLGTSQQQNSKYQALHSRWIVCFSRCAILVLVFIIKLKKKGTRQLYFLWSVKDVKRSTVELNCNLFCSAKTKCWYKNEQNLILHCAVVCLVNVFDHNLTSVTLICLHQKAAKQAFNVKLMKTVSLALSKIICERDSIGL